MSTDKSQNKNPTLPFLSRRATLPIMGLEVDRESPSANMKTAKAVQLLPKAQQTQK